MNIQSVNVANKLVEQVSGGQTQEANSPFKAFFSAAMENIDETSALQTNANEMSVDFALGKIDNVADVMIAQEKASIALQYTVQLRNKLLDAFNEIMRIQV